MVLRIIKVKLSLPEIFFGMINNIVKLIITIFIITSLIHIDGESSIVYGVPRNLITYGEGETNNYTFTNETIPENLIYLIQRLEALKEIVSKYNTTLAGEINNIELKLLSGDYEGALIDYYKLKDELEFLSRILKEINPEDYAKLVEILNENLLDYMATGGSGIDINDVIYGGMDISDPSTYDFNIPEIEETPLNPSSIDINIPSISLPSALNIDYNLLYGLLGTALIFSLIYAFTRGRLKRELSAIFKPPTTSIERSIVKFETINDPVVKTYYKFLNKCDVHGEGKHPYEGPLEHVYRLSSSSLRKIGIKIASMFEKVRYGYKKLSKEERTQIDEIARELDGVERKEHD